MPIANKPALRRLAACLAIAFLVTTTAEVSVGSELGAEAVFACDEASGLCYTERGGGIWFDQLSNVFYLDKYDIYYDGKSFLTPVAAHKKKKQHANNQPRAKLVDPDLVVRPDTLHIEGLRRLGVSCEDLIRYFKEYHPVSLEYVTEDSCNVRFPDPKNCRRALKTRGKALPFHVQMVRDTYRKVLKGSRFQVTRNEHDASLLSWHACEGGRKDVSMYMRLATHRDRHLPNPPLPPSLKPPRLDESQRLQRLHTEGYVYFEPGENEHTKRMREEHFKHLNNTFSIEKPSGQFNDRAAERRRREAENPTEAELAKEEQTILESKWKCDACGTVNPPHYEMCWRCRQRTSLRERRQKLKATATAATEAPVGVPGASIQAPPDDESEEEQGIKSGKALRDQLNEKGRLPLGKPLPESNIGYQMLKEMGWEEGKGLGKNQDGRLEPVPMYGQLDKRGVGAKYEKREHPVSAGKKKRRKLMQQRVRDAMCVSASEEEEE
mmetsp:Transcript_7197/g.13351  ORF Transcript_7197/g.13351 Transcript_7197/m.13351 type:complete len:494 (+) Transcript_7197:105-1586(+)